MRSKQEAHMRKTYILIIAAVAVAAIGLVVKTAFLSDPQAAAESMTGPVAQSTMPSLLELHRNYPNIAGLPVQDIKDPI
jgi:hypothetical protein